MHIINDDDTTIASLQVMEAYESHFCSDFEVNYMILCTDKMIDYYSQIEKYIVIMHNCFNIRMYVFVCMYVCIYAMLYIACTLKSDLEGLKLQKEHLFILFAYNVNVCMYFVHISQFSHVVTYVHMHDTS